MKRSEDVQEVLGSSNVRSTYDLCPAGCFPFFLFNLLQNTSKQELNWGIYVHNGFQEAKHLTITLHSKQLLSWIKNIFLGFPLNYGEPIKFAWSLSEFTWTTSFLFPLKTGTNDFRLSKKLKTLWVNRFGLSNLC